MRLTYSQFVEILRLLYWVSPQGMGAFKARLRKLQVEGIPEGANPGKGKRVNYSLRMLLETVVALELSQCGWSPSDVSALVRTNRQTFYLACLMSAVFDGDRDGDLFIVIDPQALKTEHTPTDAGPILVGRAWFVTRRSLVRLLTTDTITGSFRWALINLKSVMNALIALVDEHFGAELDINEIVRAEREEQAEALDDFWHHTITTVDASDG